MSPAQTAARMQFIANRLRMQHKHVIAAELALQGLDPVRDEIPFSEQVEAISELLQDVAQNLDEEASGILFDIEREEKAA